MAGPGRLAAARNDAPALVRRSWRALSTGRPVTAGTAGFRYDPADPTPSAGGQLLGTKAGPADDRRLESRADVLVFTSALLTADLEVIGPVSARFTVGMSATAYWFRAGHRIRLTVSGGAHPRFARNTGSGEPPATATRLVPADIRIRLGGTDPPVLSLPVMPPTG